MGTQVIVEKKVKVVKYIDDNLIIEKINYGNVPIQSVGGKQTKTKEASGCGNAFNSIGVRATAKDMKVNPSKTNLLCVSDSLNYLPQTFFTTSDGTRVENGEEMKLLGFMFSSRPTVALHVAMVCRKIRQKSWCLRHLKKLGMSEIDLISVYRGVVRPIADYCSVVYHSMLTDEQDESLENAQVSALRAIMGSRISGRKMREKANLPTLRNRRVEQCDKFARKCIASSKFSQWFPLKPMARNTRNPERFHELYARCDRLKNSPLYYMRRRMNGKEGKTYGERYRIYRQT